MWVSATWNQNHSIQFTIRQKTQKSPKSEKLIFSSFFLHTWKVNNFYFTNSTFHCVYFSAVSTVLLKLWTRLSTRIWGRNHTSVLLLIVVPFVGKAASNTQFVLSHPPQARSLYPVIDLGWRCFSSDKTTLGLMTWKWIDELPVPIALLKPAHHWLWSGFLCGAQLGHTGMLPML